MRWEDERTFNQDYFPEKVAFLGVEKGAMVSVGTYGCIRGQHNVMVFREGLKAMMETVEPSIVLVYGPMPEKVFGEFKAKAKFIDYPNWISLKKGGK